MSKRGGIVVVRLDVPGRSLEVRAGIKGEVIGSVGLVITPK